MKLLNCAEPPEMSVTLFGVVVKVGIRDAVCVEQASQEHVEMKAVLFWA
jgi:hypothetical protein